LDWSSLVPATIIPHKGEGLSVAFHELDAPTEELSSKPTDFLEYVDTLPEVSRQLLYHVRFIPGSKRALAECLKENKKICSASDGLLDQDEKLASFSWHLIRKGNVLVEGAGPVDSVLDTLSSTQADLFGIAAIDKLLHHFCKFYNIESTSCVIKCCNNKAAIA
jgi:hypothetical protein